jgi:hypothetical protein
MTKYILFFLKTKVFKIGTTSNTTLQWKYAEQFFQNSSINTKKYLLSDNFDNNFENIRFIKDMPFWKRVGLMIGFKQLLINNSNMVGIKEKIQSQLEQAEKTLKEPSMNYIAKVYEKAFK